MVLHSPDTIAPVGVLHPLSFHVQPKLQGQEQQHCYGVDTGGNRQQTPQPLPPAAAVTLVPLDWTPQVTQAGVAAANASDTVWSLDVRVTTSSTHVHVMCAPCRSSSSDGHGHGGSGHGDGEHVALTAADTASALLAALAAVPGALQGGGALQWETACFVTLYLADMCHFGDVNAAYCQVLPSVNPPSRACVQVRSEYVLCCQLLSIIVIMLLLLLLVICHHSVHAAHSFTAGCAAYNASSCHAAQHSAMP